MKKRNKKPNHSKAKFIPPEKMAELMLRKHGHSRNQANASTAIELVAEFRKPEISSGHVRPKHQTAYWDHVANRMNAILDERYKKGA